MPKKFYQLGFLFILYVVLQCLGCNPQMRSVPKNSENGTPTLASTNNVTPTPQRTLPPVYTPSAIIDASPTTVTRSTSTLQSTPGDVGKFSSHPGLYALLWSSTAKSLSVLDSIGGKSISLGIKVDKPIKPSPEGNRIAFLDQGFISIFDVKGNKVYPIPQPDSGAVDGIWSGDWSPDGRYLIYALRAAHINVNNAVVDEYPDLYIADLTLNKYIQITTTNYIETAPRWSPNGDWIAFLSDRDNAKDVTGSFRGSLDIYLMSTNCLAKIESCSNSFDRRLTTGGNIDPSQMSWSPKNNKLAYIAQTESVNSDIYTVTLDGLKTNITNSREIDETIFSWAPDGNSIVFRAKLLESTDLFLVSPNGGNPRMIGSFTGQLPDVPYWFPDGSGIFFLSSDVVSNTKFLDCYTVLDNNLKLIQEFDKDSEFVGWLMIYPVLDNGSILTISPQGDNLNLRSSPSTDSSAIKKLRTNEKIKILHSPTLNSNLLWMEVQVDKDTGWILQNFNWFTPDKLNFYPGK